MQAHGSPPWALPGNWDYTIGGVMQRIAIVDPSDMTREPLRNLLLGMDSVWMEAECARYEFFPDVVSQSNPDVVIVALDADQTKALQLISQLKTQYAEMPILALGDADVALDLVPDHTLAEVAHNIERLDMHFLKQSLCKHATGLELLPHPVGIEEIGLIHEEHLQRLIGLLRASYTHLVLDLSKSFTVTDLTAMRMADVILLITQLELT